MSGEEFEQALPVVRSKVLEMLGREAEDAFQEVAYRASQKAAQFQNEEELFAYIWMGTAQEKRRDVARAGERRAKLRQLKTLARSSSDGGDGISTRQAFDHACEGLTDEQKEAVWEVIYDGATTRETRLPRSTVSRLVEQVRERLRSTN